MEERKISGPGFCGLHGGGAARGSVNARIRCELRPRAGDLAHPPCSAVAELRRAHSGDTAPEWASWAVTGFPINFLPVRRASRGGRGSPAVGGRLDGGWNHGKGGVGFAEASGIARKSDRRYRWVRGGEEEGGQDRAVVRRGGQRRGQVREEAHSMFNELAEDPERRVRQRDARRGGGQLGGGIPGLHARRRGAADGAVFRQQGGLAEGCHVSRRQRDRPCRAHARGARSRCAGCWRPGLPDGVSFLLSATAIDKRRSFWKFVESRCRRAGLRQDRHQPRGLAGAGGGGGRAAGGRPRARASTTRRSSCS